ncbi:MAG: hypothetical protein ACFFG0_42370 [Candidatus Thorarchaeota archaeon]
MSEIEKLKMQIEVLKEQINDLQFNQAVFGLFISEQGLKGELEEFVNTMKAKSNS